MAKYKNPLTGRTYVTEAMLMRSFEDPILQLNLKNMGVTAKQVVFNNRNRLPLDTRTRECVISKKPTAWNERAGRYERFHSDVERKQYREIFKQRMLARHGKVHLLDRPEQQRTMLANRRISGQYTFKDGSVKTYTGKEELSALEFLDTGMDWQGIDVQCPAPQNIYYKDANGKDHFYIPDIWIESLNLIIEIKGEEHNGYRSRDMHIEQLKDSILRTSSYNYFKIEDRNYVELMEYIERLSKKD